MAYFVGWSLFFIFFKCYLSFKVVGRENVPKKGPFIFASNHRSYFDPILLGTSIHRSLNYMARENLFSGGLFGWAMRQVHAFPVKKGSGNLGALRQALNILKNGKPLVIFPEGTRSGDKELKPAKPGVGFIMARANVPVIPAYIEGSFEALPRGLMTLKRSRVAVYVGRPLKFELNADPRGKEAYRKASDDIMREIAELKKRYAGHIG